MGLMPDNILTVQKCKEPPEGGSNAWNYSAASRLFLACILLASLGVTLK